jgi:hypothetical protein
MCHQQSIKHGTNPTNDEQINAEVLATRTYPVVLDLGDVELRLRRAGELELEEVEDGLGALLELLALLEADDGAPRRLAAVLVGLHLALPDHGGRLDAVLEVQHLVLRRQVHDLQEIEGVERLLGDAAVDGVAQARLPFLRRRSYCHGTFN